MTVYAQPGSTFEANVAGGTTGQVGTIGVRISNLATDTDVLARTTAGITEYPASSGIYARSFTAPTAAGTYSIIWDISGVFAAEDLIVTSTSPGGSSPTGSDLCTLADVKAFLKKTDPADDAILQTLITAASDEITRYCSRQFTPDAANPRTHRFRSSNRIVDLSPYDLQAAATVTLNPESSSPTTLTAWTDFDLLPIDDDASLGTYYTLKLHRHVSTSHSHFLIDIDGTWGAASIPPIVRQSAYVTVAEWFRSKVTAFSTTFNDQGVHVAPAPLPTMVCGWLEPLRRIVL